MHRKTVLVVDDDASSRFVLSKAVEGLGFRAVIVEDGIDVPELVAKEHFDLLVLDLYMPGMNGYEVLRRIRQPHGGVLPVWKTQPTVGIVVLSGVAGRDGLTFAAKLGADACLQKPFDITDVLAAVRAIRR